MWYNECMKTQCKAKKTPKSQRKPQSMRMMTDEDFTAIKQRSIVECDCGPDITEDQVVCELCRRALVQEVQRLRMLVKAFETLNM